ncbi:MAG TPA: DNA cytosine methyltransferase [Aridibacter sp.]|nr:DNA cytosine methyltransferase [Aridibacter sp.]
MDVSVFSFFSGSGFLDLGFETNGFRVDFVNENHRPFVEAYKYARSRLGIDEPKFGHSLVSIEEFTNGSHKTTLSEHVTRIKNSGTLVGFIGGPPCPDFSIAGKNRGKKGSNGKLSETYVQTIIDQKPDFFVFENVKGLWRTKKHREFYEHLKRRVRGAGYSTTERLMNALEFGVPQDRDRIFLVGVKSKLTPNRISETFQWTRFTSYNKDDVLSTLVWPRAEKFEPGSSKPIPTSIAPYEELTVEYWFRQNCVASHPNCDAHFTPRSGIERMKSVDEGDDSRKSFKRLHRWRYSPTAAYGNNEVHLHPYEVRRISAAEALAIQSLPKDFELPEDMSLSNMFKTIGNGVPYLAASGLAKTIKCFIDENVG